MRPEEPGTLAILGGSSAFTPALAARLADVADLLPPLVVRLHGRDRARTEGVRRFCALVAAARGASHAYEATTDLESAVTGARVVLNQVRVGGLAARSRDESFPLPFGLPGDETIGPSGLASAIRSAGVVLESARVTAARAPGAWFVNLTNPLGVLTAILGRVKGVRAFGLCELPAVTLRKALASIGEGPDGVESDYFGVNHQGWFTRIAKDGVDLLPAIIAALVDQRGGWLPVDAEVARDLGALPLPYWRLYCHTDRACREQRARPRTRGDELLELSTRLRAHYAMARSGELPSALMRRDMPWIAEAVVPAVVALFGGPEAPAYVSERNGGYLPALAPGAVIEKPCSIGVGGPREIRPRAAPTPAVLELLGAIVRFESAAVAAALAPDRDRVLSALSQHPLTCAHGALESLADAVLSAAESGDVAVRAS